jgi:hypothetical protein
MTLDSSSNLAVTGNVSATAFSGDGSGLTGVTAGSLANSVTFNNGGGGAASGTAFNGAAGVTVSWNTIGAVTTGNTNQTIAGTKTFSGTIVANNTITGSISGNAATATTLQTARLINGTSFDGSADITTLNWGTARTIWGNSINGGANVTAPVRPAAGSVTAPAFSTSGDTNTGIYFSAADTMNVTTGGTLAATFAANGNFTATGEVTAFSDARLKDNIEVIADPLTKILKLRGVTFTRTDQEDQERVHMGVIAQEVEQYFPEVVHTTSDGTKTVNYGAMAGAFIEAFKEQQSQIDELREMIKKLMDK